MTNEAGSEQEPRMVGDRQLEDDEVYVHGADKPQGEGYDGYKWVSVPETELNPYGNADNVGGWIGKKRTSSERKYEGVDMTGWSDDDKTKYKTTGLTPEQRKRMSKAYDDAGQPQGGSQRE